VIHRTLFSFALVLCTATTAPLCVRASTIISDLTSTPNGVVTVSNSAPVYGEFSLTNSATINSATMTLQGGAFPPPVSQISVSIVSDNAGTPGASTLGTSGGGTGSLGFLASNVTFTFGSPISLSPGTYWLKLTDSSTTASLSADFTTSPSTAGTDGNVLSKYYSGVTATSGRGLIFSLTGTVDASPPPPPDVPELDQGSAFAAVSALGMGVAMIRRRPGKST